jgi:putative PIN family toxin of toxin-antitoxin system
MKVVVDTNILFSAALTQNGTIAQTLFSDEYEFFVPHFAIIELFKYKDKIIKFSKKSEVEVLEILYHILSQLSFVNEKSISLESRQKAYDLCKNIDLKDAAFVALAIELNALLWTGDLKLKNGLIEIGFDFFL